MARTRQQVSATTAGCSNNSKNVSGKSKRDAATENKNTSAPKKRPRPQYHSDDEPTSIKQRASHSKVSHDDHQSQYTTKKRKASTPPSPKAEDPKAPRTSVSPEAPNSKLRQLIQKYGKLPLSELGLSSPSSPTPENVLALVLNALLTSARISHHLAHQSVKCLLEARYHEIQVLKGSTWEERTEVLTKGGYTHYREKTATGLGELAEFVIGRYGMWKFLILY